MSVADSSEETGGYFRIWFLKRLVILFLALLVAITLVFAFIHLGPQPPVEAGGVGSEDQARLEAKKQAFGLYRPLGAQYADYLGDMLTFDFGQSWHNRNTVPERRTPITDVNALIINRLIHTAWLWFWALLITLVIGLPVGFGLGLRGTTRSASTASVGGAIIRAAPVFLVSVVLLAWLPRLQSLIGFNWYTFIVEIPTLTGRITLSNLTDPRGFLIAVKRVFPPALVLASALLGTTIRVGQRAMQETLDADFIDVTRAKGIGTWSLVVNHLFRNAVVPFVSTLRATVAILIGGAIVIEHNSVFNMRGIGRLFHEAVEHGDYTTLQATLFVFFLLLIGVTLLQDVVYAMFGGTGSDGNRRVRGGWTAPKSTLLASPWELDGPRQLRSLARTKATGNGISARIRANPRPAIIWLLGGFVLVGVEVGALVNAVAAIPGMFPTTVNFPSLLSREVIPNVGHQMPGGGWTGTFLGLSPAYAWALRVGLVYLYAVAWLAWGWIGYRLYRARYRGPDRTPTDAVFSRLRGHRWGQFGFVVVFLFVVTAVFAPALGPTTFDRTRASSTLHSLDPKPVLGGTITYFNEETSAVTTTSITSANLQAETGMMSYDSYGRFHPFGTASEGTDLFTELLFGTRVYLFVGLVALLIAGTVALVLGVLSGYDRGYIDGVVGGVSDVVSIFPLIPVAMLLTSYLDRTWITDPFVTLVVIAVLFGLLFWSDLWRTVRGLALRTNNAQWVDAARGFGQRPGALLRKRLMPLVVGYLLVYMLQIMAGTIIATAALSYIGTTVWTFPMEWSSFIALIPVSPPRFLISAAALVVVITGFTALADGLRDALDPEREVGTSAPGETAGAGGGG
jgi:peptide/nickel transport system permease protein